MSDQTGGGLDESEAVGEPGADAGDRASRRPRHFIYPALWVLMPDESKRR